jgi:hypothetical protein
MATTLQLLQGITSGDAGWQQARDIILSLSATVQNAARVGRKSATYSAA